MLNCSSNHSPDLYLSKPPGPFCKLCDVLMLIFCRYLGVSNISILIYCRYIGLGDISISIYRRYKPKSPNIFYWYGLDGISAKLCKLKQRQPSKNFKKNLQNIFQGNSRKNSFWALQKISDTCIFFLQKLKFKAEGVKHFFFGFVSKIS